MAWTAPSTAATVSTGGIGLAADWNTYLRDNTLYLYAGLTTVTQTSPAKVLDTIYQNTTSFLKIADIGISLQFGSTNMTCRGLCGSTNPPVTEVSRVVSMNAYLGQYLTGQITIHIPPNYYYTASSLLGIPRLLSWVEYAFG